MTDPNPLTKYMVPEGAGAGFRATREGGLALIEPLTVKAEVWLRSMVAEESSWVGDAVAVEMRYFPGLVDAIIEAGFFFERDALPN